MRSTKHLDSQTKFYQRRDSMDQSDIVIPASLSTSRDEDDDFIRILHTASTPSLSNKTKTSSYGTIEEGHISITPLVSHTTTANGIVTKSVSETSLIEYYQDIVKKSSTIRSILLEDAIEILSLAIPMFVATATWTAMKITDTALLGHVASEALDASALADLWMMCTGVLFQGRVLGMLCSQAIGAGNPHLAGVYLQISYFVLALVSVFVILSWNMTETVWTWIGETDDEGKGDLLSKAGYYSRVLSLSIPGQVAINQLTQYLAAQKIMYPEVISSLLGFTLNVVLGLYFVLGIPSIFSSTFDGYGFNACPIVTVVVLYLQGFVLWYFFCHRMGLHKVCWKNGWNWNEITKERIFTFSQLYFPSAFSLASDFWRMAVVGTFAARMGPDQVGLFNASYKFIWISMILVISLSNAASIRMGVLLGRGDPKGAKMVAYMGAFLSLIVLAIISYAMISYFGVMSSIMTQDEYILKLFDECKFPFLVTLFFMNLAIAIEKIPLNLGRTKDVFWYGFIASWGGQVPAVLAATSFWRNDLVGLYTGVAYGYVVLTVLYAILTINTDWEKYSALAIKRSEVSKS